MYDNIIVGPTAEETDVRSHPAIDANITVRLCKVADTVIPNLTGSDVVRMYTGVRPATESKDYHILCNPDRYGIFVDSVKRLQIIIIKQKYYGKKEKSRQLLLIQIHVNNYTNLKINIEPHLN